MTLVLKVVAKLVFREEFINSTDLFLKDGIVIPSILCVKIPTPVDYHHCQRGCEESNDEETGA